jgi:signal transduction histidine kinase
MIARVLSFALILCSIQFLSAAVRVVDPDTLFRDQNAWPLTAVNLSWSLLQPPDPNSSSDHYDMFSTQYGIAVRTDEKGSAWWRNGKKWEKITRLQNYAAERPFFVGQNKLWFVIPGDIEFKQNLLFFDDGRLTPVQTPNADGIRDLFFTSPDNGWAACEWGQILHYNGDKWSLFPSPTLYHIHRLLMVNHTLAFAATDNANQNNTFILKYNGKEWSHFKTAASIDIHLMPDYVYDLSSDSICYHHTSRRIKPNTRNDTIRFLQPFNVFDVLWIGPARTRMSGDKTATLVDLQKVNTDQVVSVVWNGRREADGYQYDIFYLFSLTGLERKLVFASPLPRFYDFKKRFRSYNMSKSMAEHGICIADFNRDDWPDLYIVGTGRPNRLYLLKKRRVPLYPFAKFDIAEQAGVVGPTQFFDGTVNFDEGVSCADIDNDGDQDLFLSSLYGHNSLYRHGKKMQFQDFTVQSGLDTMAARTQHGIWADVDNDGAVDLFVVNSDTSNRLWLNNGAGIFSDITQSAGLGCDFGSTGAAFGDIDGDLDVDLVVSRANKRNLLYINDSDKPSREIKFQEQGRLRGVVGFDSLAKSSSVSLADLDNDGDLDIFVTNIFTSNEIFENDGNGFFQHQTGQSGLQDAAPSQTAVIFDADNDGDLDIYVGNRGRDDYYENLGNGRFEEDFHNQFSTATGLTTGIACGDLDQNGAPDLYIGFESRESQVLINGTQNKKAIQISVRGQQSSRDAVGTRLFFYIAGHTGEPDHLQGMRQVYIGSGHNSSDSRVIFFGVPDDKARDVVARFPSGITKTIHHLSPGHKIWLDEHSGCTAWYYLSIKHIHRLVHNPMYMKQFMFVLAVLLLFSLKPLFIALLRGNPRSRKVALISSLVFLFLFAVLYDRGWFISYALPLLISSTYYGIGMILAYRSARWQSRRFDVQEQLYQVLTAFFHGGWGSKRINRLQMYLSNLDAVDEKTDLKEQLLDTVDQFFSLVVPEIEKIISLNRKLKLSGSDIQPLLLTAGKELVQIKNELYLDKAVSGERIAKINTTLSTLLNGIRNLHTALEKEYSADLNQILQSLDTTSGNDVAVEMQNALPASVRVRMQPAQLSQILQNLLDNSIRAMKSTQTKRLTISVRANREAAIIRVSDTGPGIDDAVRDRLFKRPVSTKAQKGGFGLYHSQRVLQKYSGNLSLVQTGAEGTVFELRLERI